MPSYSYTVWNDEGERELTVVRVFPMDKHPESIDIDGSTAVRDIAADFQGVPTSKLWEPDNRHPSTSLGIHPDHLKQYQAFDKSRGVSVDYVPDRAGMLRPDPTSMKQRIKYGEAHGFVDRT